MTGKPEHRNLAVKIIVCALVAVLLPAVGLTKEINSNAGTTGFSFLKLGVGARAVAMGGAYTGLSNDPTAMYYNPAATSNISGKQFLAGYHNYVLDLQSGFIAATMPFQEKHHLGLFINYLNFGSFTKTDIDGVPIGEFSGGDFLIGANYSTYVHRYIALGVNFKFMTEFADGYSAQAIAFDIGAFGKLPDSLTTLGLMVYNIGGVTSGFSANSNDPQKEKLPLGVRAGVSHSLRELPVILAFDAVLPNDNDPYFNVGFEVYRLKPLYIRAGYSLFGENYKTSSGNDALAGTSFGFGLDYKNFQISYAFMPYLDLGSSHRVTITGNM